MDYQNLGFGYHEMPYRYTATWKDGQWSKGGLTTDSQLHISEASPALHYGQQCFEGLKAYRRKDGRVQLFRPQENAARFQRSARRLMMAEVPTEMFLAAVTAVAKANEEFVPPYGTGATLYLRPLLIGVGGSLGLKPAEEFLFVVFASPVGAYFKDGMKPANFSVAEYDRAAPLGTGANKVGGNYAGSLYPQMIAHDKGFADAIFLDPATHTKIEEVGSANFFGITKDGRFITPLSPSILPSITKYSLLYLAQERLGLEVVEGDVYIDHLEDFIEAGACGTAAVITPIGGIYYQDKMHVFYSQTEVGPYTQKLYDELTGIQAGDVPAPAGWITIVE